MSERVLSAVIDDGQGNGETVDPVLRVVVYNGYNEYELPLQHGATIRLEEIESNGY